MTLSSGLVESSASSAHSSRSKLCRDVAQVVSKLASHGIDTSQGCRLLRWSLGTGFEFHGRKESEGTIKSVDPPGEGIGSPCSGSLLDPVTLGAEHLVSHRRIIEVARVARVATVHSVPWNGRCILAQ